MISPFDICAGETLVVRGIRASDGELVVTLSRCMKTPKSLRHPPAGLHKKHVVNPVSTTPYFPTPPFPRRLWTDDERTPPGSPTPSPSSGVSPPEGEVKPI